MNSKISIVAIYVMLAIIGSFGSVVAPLSRVIGKSNVLFWSYFDLGATTALAVYILANLLIIGVTMETTDLFD